MPPARHNTRLSTVREMDDAFDDDDNDDQQESTPLTHFHRQSSVSTAPPLFRGETDPARPNAYDFEREYDFPPPGSPPSPSTSALPNDYGNSNGHLPTSPVIRSSMPQSGFPVDDIWCHRLFRFTTSACPAMDVQEAGAQTTTASSQT